VRALVEVLIDGVHLRRPERHCRYLCHGSIRGWRVTRCHAVMDKESPIHGPRSWRQSPHRPLCQAYAPPYRRKGRWRTLPSCQGATRGHRGPHRRPARFRAALLAA
jgi:hypothetical protein